MNKNRIIAIIIFSIFFILSISAYYNTLKQKEFIELKHQQSFDVMQQMIDGKIIFFRKQFSNRIKNMVYKRDEFKNIILSQDRDSIIKVIDKLFKNLKKENRYSKTLHFISKNNISLYRAHKPTKYGDDLTKVRPIIEYVNKHKRAKYGFEAGKYAMVYRVAIPIIYDDIHYGTLEYGIDANMFVDDLTSVSNYIKSAILVDTYIYKKLQMDDLELKNKALNKTSNYIVFASDKFFNKIDLGHIKQNTHFDKNKEHYVSFLYNLLSFDGISNGKILLAINMTADKQTYMGIIKSSIISLIILMLIILIIVYYAFSYYEKKIIKLTAIEKKNEQVIHQQSKMASMGEMIGNIAHQWRQPLSVISTMASGISMQKQYDLFDEKTLTKSMDTIVDQTQFMSKTIDDFRDFFKTDKEKIKFELNNVIEQNISLMNASLKSHNIQLQFTPSEKIYINGYQNELTQSIINILNNAKDQLVKLHKETKRFIQIKISIDSENINISIADNAGGVPKDIIGKIFEPYFTTKHQTQGTGIGLYMTHEIIYKHFNGDIKVMNENIDIDGIIYDCAIFKIILPKN
ncbi:MAG: hypothetical protein DRG78_15145 [Epsilonproteobacteria bacterium]|nr:MAG: hypothetical protein DRG78_15145 [Campylobacterota bacterium]